MKNLKFTICHILKCLVVLVIYLVVISLLNYVGFIKESSILKINFVFVAGLSFVHGIISGKKTSKKGYLEGIKFGSIFTLVLLILNLLFYRVFSLTLVLYYLLIIVSSTIGSMIGINLRHK